REVQALPQPGQPDRYTSETRGSLRFNYPLIVDVLRFCRCVLGNGQAEISPRSLPIQAVPSFANASRRIVMSATLADDGILVSHFDLDPDSITKAITHLTANDIGDRMILVLQDLITDFDDENI